MGFDGLRDLKVMLQDLREASRDLKGMFRYDGKRAWAFFAASTDLKGILWGSATLF